MSTALKSPTKVCKVNSSLFKTRHFLKELSCLFEAEAPVRMCLRALIDCIFHGGHRGTKQCQRLIKQLDLPRGIM